MSLKIGCVGSKTRSLGQILEKPCVHSKGHIFRPIIMKRGQNVCLDEISDKFGNGSCRVKKKESHDGPVLLHWLILGNLFKT